MRNEDASLHAYHLGNVHYDRKRDCNTQSAMQSILSHAIKSLVRDAVNL